MYDHILVPTDGSEGARAAMTEAVALAQIHAAAIHGLHGIHDWHYDTSIDSAVAPLRDEGEAYVAELTDLARETDVPVTTVVELGRPGRDVLDYVGANDIDLVVMGATGRGGLPRRLLGSTTDYVVTHADVPVHVVPTVEA
jgi:nucleotide-binding universal stress UspA family protein